MVKLMKGSKVVIMNGSTPQRIMLVESSQDGVITLEDGTQYGRDGKPIRNDKVPWEPYCIVPYTVEAESEIMIAHRTREAKKAIQKYIQDDGKKTSLKRTVRYIQAAAILDILSPDWRAKEQKYRAEKCKS